MILIGRKSLERSLAGNRGASWASEAIVAVTNPTRNYPPQVLGT